MRVLHSFRPHGDVAEAVVAALPPERFGLGETCLEQQDPFLVAFAGFPRVGAVGEVLIGSAPQHADAQATVQEVVEHRVLLGDAHRIVQGQVRAEDADLRVGESTTGDRGEDDGVRCQLLRGVVVLGEVQRVETGVERRPHSISPCSIVALTNSVSQIRGGAGHESP